ncbi:MAG: tryptophan synthase subunit alpha [Chloroflexi bacterium]|nr:tryptophan synthase subunit alpha [Chloroflexota bacterium]
MNRIDRTFAQLKAADRLGLFPYLTVGFPDLDATEQLALAMLEAGADGIELGIPFSDPVADGVTLQHASERALSNGASVSWALDVVARLRGQTDAPLIAMTYYNPIYHYGLARLVQDAAVAGIDGLIVPDLPTAEASPLLPAAKSQGIHLIQMVAPTSTPQHLEEVGRIAQGFVYCVSLVGTTGARAQLSDRLPAFMKAVRDQVSQPLLVGFGISRPEHVAALHTIADGCIVASAIADLIEATPAAQRIAALSTYIASLRAACEPSAVASA